MSQLARDLLVDEAHTDLLLLLTEGQTYLGIWVHRDRKSTRLNSSH